ncbi:hypothetical protein ACQ4LK_23100, partial [Bacillus pumilus]
MNNLVILPILIPLLAATLLIFMNKNIMLSSCLLYTSP